MKLLVTGSTGFLGRFVVAEALRRGHTVRAVVRSASSAQRLGWVASEKLEFAHVDLRSRKGLVEALQGVDCVLHLAAKKAGDIMAQLHGTVVTTENLIWAMGEASVSHVVHVSTFSVYDYARIPAWSVIDESSPLESKPETRDEYAQTKLIQERLIVEEATKRGWKWTVLRPGMIYGPDNAWGARLGMGGIGKRTWLRLGSNAPLPVNYVENTADAIVLAAGKPNATGHVFNLLDDETPTQRQYTTLLRDRATPRPRVIPVPRFVMNALASMATISNRVFFKNQAKVPGIFVPAKLDARIKPMRFSNVKGKQLLGWAPRVGLVEGLDRSTKPGATS